MLVTFLSVTNVIKRKNVMSVTGITSKNFQQHIWSPSSVINIDVTDNIFFVGTTNENCTIVNHGPCRGTQENPNFN